MGTNSTGEAASLYSLPGPDDWYVAMSDDLHAHEG